MNLKVIYTTYMKITNKVSAISKKPSAGFALLLTLVIVSVVLAIGLSLLQITSKQASLSSVARESEIALNAATTGTECMQYYRARPETEAAFLNKPYNDVPVNESARTTLLNSLKCGDVNSDSLDREVLAAGKVFNYVYVYNIDYGNSDTTDDTCVEVSLYMTDLGGDSSNIDQALADEGLDSLTCSAGSICTTIFSRGYNRPCDQLDSIFTVQRELTVEY